MNIKQWILYLGRRGKHDIGMHKRNKKNTIHTDIAHEQHAGN